MKFITISDLHRAPPDSPASDWNRDATLALFLQRKHQEGFKIILNGDTEELWQFKQKEVEDANPLSSEAIEKYAHVIIRGNHDNVDPICNRNTIDSYYYRDVLWMHGHDPFDIANSAWGWIGRSTTWLAGIAERVIHRDIDTWLRGIWDKLCKHGRYSEADKYRFLAARYRDEHGLKGLVLGHTHRWDQWQLGYGNAGTWTGMNIDSLEFEL